MQSTSNKVVLQKFLWLSQLIKSFVSVLQGVRRIVRLIPPSGLIILSCFAMQAGNAGTKMLFDWVGVIGAVFICRMVASVVLLLLHRPQLREYTWQNYWLVTGMGLTISGTVIAFYEAVARIPLGIASTIEFIGPLCVAVVGSRRKLDLVWILCAAIGVFLLSPVNSVAINPVGMGCALIAAGGWASNIVFSKRVGQVFPGQTGLALAVTVAAIVIMPIGIGQGGTALLQPQVLIIGAGVGFLGTVIPLSLEYDVLKRIQPRVFGVLVSIEPVIAALIGLVFLNEHLNSQNVIAILLVTLASVGVTLFGVSNSNQ